MTRKVIWRISGLPVLAQAQGTEMFPFVSKGGHHRELWGQGHSVELSE